MKLDNYRLNWDVILKIDANISDQKLKKANGK